MKLKRAVEISLIIAGTISVFLLVAGMAFDRPQAASKAALTSAGTTSQSALKNAPGATENTAQVATSSSASSSSAATDGNTAKPVVTISASPDTINNGQSSTLTWTSTNSPTSCTGSGGSFGGDHPVNGSSGTGILQTTTTYSLACTNASGNATAAVTITVNHLPVCGQPGAGCTPSEVAAHNSQKDCWVIYSGSYYIVTKYVDGHPGGTIAFNSQTCGHDITAYMNGNQTISGSQKHNHSASAYAILNSYKVGPVSG